jgi:hypothetical protein
MYGLSNLNSHTSQSSMTLFFMDLSLRDSSDSSSDVLHGINYCGEQSPGIYDSGSSLSQHQVLYKLSRTLTGIFLFTLLNENPNIFHIPNANIDFETHKTHTKTISNNHRYLSSVQKPTILPILTRQIPNKHNESIPKSRPCLPRPIEFQWDITPFPMILLPTKLIFKFLTAK